MKTSIEFLIKNDASNRFVDYYNSIGNPCFLSDTIILNIIQSKSLTGLDYIRWIISTNLTNDQNMLWAKNSLKKANEITTGGDCYNNNIASAENAFKIAIDASYYGCQINFAVTSTVCYACNAISNIKEAIVDIIYFGINMARSNC